MRKLPKNVTPLRSQKGRPTVVPDGVRLTIHIEPIHRIHAERIGNGNVSQGIRELLDRAIAEENKHPI